MSLTEAQVKHVAKLASLELSEEELKKLQVELKDILTYIDTLTKIDTRGVLPTSHVHGMVNAFRDDLVKESLPLEALEQNAPTFRNAHFVVPKII